jgi:hypothetical protein
MLKGYKSLEGTIVKGLLVSSKRHYILLRPDLRSRLKGSAGINYRGIL